MIVVVATTEDEIERLRARLVALGATDLEIRAPSDVRRLVLAAVADEGKAERIASWLRDEGEIAFARAEGGARFEAWMRHTRPLVFAGRVSVCFAWSEHDRRDLPGLVELGPNGFGNGEHPTTRLLIEQLATRITGGERVLDVGCGSGVLGLCALQLGASRVTAADIDNASVHATRRNAALNGFEASLQATPSPLDMIDDAYDVVVANVGRAAIVALAPQLARLLAPDGWLAVSGIAASQRSLVAGFLRPLIEIESPVCGEWAAVVLEHPRETATPAAFSPPL